MIKQLTFVPLGGSGEIGMNLNLYGYGDEWLMVDCGMMIDSSEGADQIFVPEIDFLRGKTLVGMVLTHAHEDHIGGITDLWLELRCPLYTTPFTAAVIRRKLSESEIKEKVPFKIQPPASRFTVGEHFDCELVPVTHSTVESQSVVIRTPVGNVFHTGDWKLDPAPLVGLKTAEKRIKEIGQEGVLAVVGDSTNAQVEGESGSESEVKNQLRQLILEEKGRVVCTSFSSNIARLMTFFKIAQETQRNPVIIGRSLKRMVAAAQETGYIPRDLPLVPPRDAMYLPPERVLIVCTGSQGEARAALSRIAEMNHPDIYLEESDTVFFSSRVIPGNEEEIERLKGRLGRLGVKIVDEEEAFIHVSGHPCVNELKTMYSWLQPQLLIPVHGYPPHLAAHAEVGRKCEIPQVLEVRNGDIVTLGEEEAEIMGSTPTGRRLRIEPEPRWRGGNSHNQGRTNRGRRGGRPSQKRGSRQETSGQRKPSGQREASGQRDSSEKSRRAFMESFKRGRN